MKTYSLELNESEVSAIGEKRWFKANWRIWATQLGVSLIFVGAGAMIGNWVTETLGNILTIIGVGIFLIAYFRFMMQTTAAGKLFLKEVQTKIAK